MRNQGVQSCGEVHSGGAQRAHLESLCGPSTPHQATQLRAQTHQSPHTGQRVDSKRSACATRECRAAARCRAPRRGGCAQRTHFEGFEGHCGPSTPRHATPLHTRTPQRPLHAQQPLGRSQTLGSSTCCFLPRYSSLLNSLKPEQLPRHRGASARRNGAVSACQNFSELLRAPPRAYSSPPRPCTGFRDC